MTGRAGDVYPVRAQAGVPQVTDLDPYVWLDGTALVRWLDRRANKPRPDVTQT